MPKRVEPRELMRMNPVPVNKSVCGDGFFIMLVSGKDRDIDEGNFEGWFQQGI